MAQAPIGAEHGSGLTMPRIAAGDVGIRGATVDDLAQRPPQRHKAGKGACPGARRASVSRAPAREPERVRAAASAAVNDLPEHHT